ncbi:hypothetical protein [Nocardia inohanensis]|uniref:hypothetical protein n=1 Tax=Nocardia inohanensis TaxID=209246 RepID=UPI0008343EE1|nr:hypothetical protein [Nocardia inohanensis]
MNRRTLTQRAATTVALAASAIVLGAQTAAEPQPSPLDLAITQLNTTAGDNAEAKAAVEATAKTAKLISAAKLGNIAFESFGYQAPTLGCGSNLPITMTAASAISGSPGADNGLNAAPGTLRFQAAPMHSGMPLASGLSVAWLNVANGRSGINGLDDVTEYNLPALTKTVDSGAGTIVASLWGTIDYPGARCLVLPTVGLFTVAELPKDPAQAQASTGSGGGSSDAGAAAPTSTVPTSAAPTAPVAPAHGTLLTPN